MSKRQLLYLTAVLVVVIAAGILVKNARERSWQSRETVGRELLTDFPVNDVHAIEIAGPADTVTLARKEEMWRVTDRYGYPADFGKISSFMQKLVDMKALKYVEAGPSQYGRLNLRPHDEESGGIDILFFDEQDAAMKSIRLGKKHTTGGEGPPSPMGRRGGPRPNGRYILLPESEDIVVVPEQFQQVSADPANWLHTEFFKIGKIRNASLTQDGTVNWEVMRDTEDADLQLADVPADREPKESAVRKIDRAFSYARFKDVADPDLSAEDTGLDTPRIFTATDVEGFTYTVRIGKQTDAGDHYLTATVSYEPPPADEDEKEDASAEDAPQGNGAENEGEKNREQTIRENRRKAEEISERLDGWTYIVSDYTVKGVLQNKQDLLKEPPAKEDQKGDEAEKAGGIKKNDGNSAPAAGTGAMPPPPPPPPAPAPDGSE